VGSNGTINFVNAALTTSGTFSTATTGDFVDGIAFDPTGNFLFLSNRSPSFRLTILDRCGGLVQHAPMSSEPDGISFHAVTPKFVVTSNANGTMTRFDFPGDDFTRPPVQSVFASGGSRGDLAQVGPDSCMYLTQYRTRYDNGTVAGQDSLVRICPGFATPTPAPENTTAGCSVLSGSVRMSRRGAVGVRVACRVAAKGTLRLEFAGSHKRAKKKHRTLTLGRKAFSLKAGRSTLTLRLTRTGRRLVVRRKRVRARATITLEGVANASTTSGVLTIKARAKRNRPR
jgi:hypothetical protein